MFSKFLKQISRNNVFLIKPIKKTNPLQNPVIFGYGKITYLKEFRIKYMARLYSQKIKLEKISKNITKSKNKLSQIEYKILKNEIKFVYKKIDFLKNIYDFEANKLDSNYEVTFPEFDYDYYNKKFFGVTKKDIHIEFKIEPYIDKTSKIPKSKLIELLDITKKEVPGFKYKFGSFVFMSHSSGVLNIPSKKYYSLREVITLFYHEMNHFFRRYNHLRNFNTSYGFNDYMKIEEGFALYNEYYYGSKLIKGLKYTPFYEACFKVLINHELKEEEKIEGIYKILKQKGFSRKKSLYYYYRFNRYSSIGSHEFFLKDLVYTKGYRLVKSILRKDPSKYDKIFCGRIGKSMIDSDFIDTNKNFDVKSYYDSMLIEIKEIFGLK